MGVPRFGRRVQRDWGILLKSIEMFENVLLRPNV